MNFFIAVTTVSIIEDLAGACNNSTSVQENMKRQVG